jgi:hypothetical protein
MTHKHTYRFTWKHFGRKNRGLMHGNWTGCWSRGEGRFWKRCLSKGRRQAWKNEVLLGHRYRTPWAEGTCSRRRELATGVDTLVAVLGFLVSPPVHRIPAVAGCVVIKENTLVPQFRSAELLG